MPPPPLAPALVTLVAALGGQPPGLLPAAREKKEEIVPLAARTSLQHTGPCVVRRVMSGVTGCHARRAGGGIWVLSAWLLLVVLVVLVGLVVLVVVVAEVGAGYGMHTCAQTHGEDV